MVAGPGEGRPLVEDALDSVGLEAEELDRKRSTMVQAQLIRRGITDAAVLAAISRVPRHQFIDKGLWKDAYSDFPLPIGYSQTISQPYMVARMSELCALSENSRVLEVGAGCGYQSAILGAVAREVYAIEIIPHLAEIAQGALSRLGFENVVVRCGDGALGWLEHAPYDAILVAAGASQVPPALSEQLADEGRLVIPVGPRAVQRLKVITRDGEHLKEEEDTACRFVELRGDYGWGS